MNASLFGDAESGPQVTLHEDFYVSVMDLLLSTKEELLMVLIT